MERRTRATALVALVAVSIAGCDSDDGRTLDAPTQPLPAPPVAATTVPPATAPVEMFVVTPWAAGGEIPTRFTCDGDDVAPSVSWANVPPETAELAITLTDLDAPSFVHWVVTGVSTELTGLAEGSIPDGARQWTNSLGDAGYAGPCPPAGVEHRYQITLHALNQPLEAADDAPATEIVSMLNLLSADQSSVSGTFARGG